MTEKRFESRQSINKTGYVVTDNKKQYTFPVMSENDCFMFCKVLNKLYEENRELQRHLDFMRSGALTDDKRIKELYDENEQLNKSRDELISENRHIKKTIQTMLINERTAIGKSVLKQLWNAIHME